MDLWIICYLHLVPKSYDVLNAGILQPLVLSTYIITSSQSHRIVYGMLESFNL